MKAQSSVRVRRQATPEKGKCTFHQPGCAAQESGEVIPCLLADGSVLVHVCPPCLQHYLLSGAWAIESNDDPEDNPPAATTRSRRS
jgi:hypothetical protein